MAIYLKPWKLLSLLKERESVANRVLGPRFEDEEKEKTREGMIRNVEEKEVS